MSKRKFSKKELVEILIKKASGFYYSEEVFEYEKTQKQPKNTEKQVNMFDFPENLKKYDTVEVNHIPSDDIMKMSNEKPNLSEQNIQTLALAKKKVTTHFVPPDMLAIKILFEIFGEKVGDEDLQKLSDRELINLKNKLIGEIKNEDNKNS